MSHPQLALGTVQFGLNYGITNAAGQVDAATAAQLLLQAQAAGGSFLEPGDEPSVEVGWRSGQVVQCDLQVR